MQHKISLTGLRVFAYHGVFDFERQNGQDFYIDASVWIDGDKAAMNDDLAATINYGELAVTSSPSRTAKGSSLVNECAA